MDKVQIRIISVLLIITILILFCLIAIKPISKEAKLVDMVSESLSEKKEQIVYVIDSSDKKCKYCDEVKDYLDKKNINYTLFDIAKSKDSYDELLDTLKIDKEVFNYPGIIYVKDGIMYANIINIDSIKTVDTFIEDYQLTSVK